MYTLLACCARMFCMLYAVHQHLKEPIMQSDRYITLKCGTVLRLSDLEIAGISFVPCGQINGEDQPLLKFAHLWGHRNRVTRRTYGKKWNAFALRGMTGIQLMTGFPTYKRSPESRYSYLYYTSLDIERRMIEKFPDEVAKIRTLYQENVIGTPCILSTKSDGLRLDAYTPYVGKKMAFKDAEGKMLFEILADKCLTRIDHRYPMLSGSLLELPALPKETLQEIYHIVNAIATQERTADDKPRTVVEKSQIGDLHIEWDSEGRSQLFPTLHCQRTAHTSNRDEVRFTKHTDGSIDGKCFNCGETWWEIPPKTNNTPKAIPPTPINVHTPSFTHWTEEERIVVSEVLGLYPDAEWHEGIPAYATRYENLHKITGEFALNGQPQEVEKRRVWSTQFGRCEVCGDITAEWIDRYLLTAGRYCNSCHADTHIGSYLEYELARKLPNSIVSEHQGYLGDDPEFHDFRLWQPEMLTHLGAGMATGKSTEIYKAQVSLAEQKIGVGIIASPRISLTRFLAHQLRKRHGRHAWGLWHEGSGRGEQYIGTYGAIVCLPSLGRAVASAYSEGLQASDLYVAIDEIDFGYALLSLAVHQATAVKKALLDIFMATGLVISGQTESTLALEAFASELGCEHLQGFYNTAPPADGVVEMRKYPDIEGKNALVLAGAIESIDATLGDGFNVYVFCSSRRDSDVVAERFSQYAPVCYNAYTKGDPRCDAVLKNQKLPDGSRLFVGTSAAGVGISILDERARTIIIAGLNHGSRGTSMLVQKAVRDRGRRGVELHHTDYSSALPIRPRETERVSLYHEEIKQLENQYAHLSENAVKKVARSIALSTLADHQLEVFVGHHLGEIGNMQVIETLALLPEDTEVEWVTEQRRDAIKTERDEKCRLTIEILSDNRLLTRHEIRVKSHKGAFTQTEQIAHEYANGLARAVGWNDHVGGILEDVYIAVAMALAEQNVQPDRLEKLRRGYFAVHYPEYVTAVFNKELSEAIDDAVNAGVGIEITSIRDDRFLGEVLKALLHRLKDEVFNDVSLAAAIWEVLDTVSEGQTLFGRIKQGGLGAQAYRRSRFLKTADDSYVINWLRTFIKEFYIATLSKRGNSYTLVHDKRTDIILASFKCWLSQRIEGDLPELVTGFDALDPQTEKKQQARKMREAGVLLEVIAAELDESYRKVQDWCKDIKVEKETVRGNRVKVRAEREALKQKVIEMHNAGKIPTEIIDVLNVSRSTVLRWTKK